MTKLQIQILICLTFTILLGAVKLTSQTEISNASDFNLVTAFGFKSSASYYAPNGNNVIELIDSNRKENNIYTFDLKNYVFDIGFYYSITDELQLRFDIPLNYSLLSEVYLKDTNVASTSYGKRLIRAELSYFLPENYKLNLLYHLMKGKFNTFLEAGLNIPPNFKNGKQNNSDFLYYSSFQIPIGLILNFISNGDWVEGRLFYNYRAGDFSDEIKIHLEGGFTSVPDTKLAGMIDYTISSGNIDESSIFNIRQNPLKENALYLGAEFFIKLHKKIETSISYNVSVLGKNSWSFGIFGLKANFSL
ncbi:MAG: hypothetical protein N2319_05875 [Candidatus Kapabacteria bacterium]|nr:hypothetical protein [Candidatus Kapabacteria bacterium]